MPTLEPPCAAPSLSTESEGVRRELGDASGADTPDKQAALGEMSEGRSGCSERAADEVPDEAGSVPDARETEPEEAAALLSAKSMWTRALRMFTAGAGTPCNSAMGSVAEPSTNELLMLVDDAANELFDAEERGELQLTAGPLDRIDARGFLLADVLNRAHISVEDAAKVGKRAQVERINGKKTGMRKDKAAIEKAAYLKEYKLRAAAVKDSTDDEAVLRKVKIIESEAEVQLAELMSKPYETLF